LSITNVTVRGTVTVIAFLPCDICRDIMCFESPYQSGNRFKYPVMKTFMGIAYIYLQLITVEFV